jgi:hypothetical protein
MTISCSARAAARAAGAITVSRGQSRARRLSYLSPRMPLKILSAASTLTPVLSMLASRWGARRAALRVVRILAAGTEGVVLGEPARGVSYLVALRFVAVPLLRVVAFGGRGPVKRATLAWA